MNIKVTKLTNVDLLRKANSFTTGKESGMSLKTAYRTLHSPARTQLFTIEFEGIPLFVASQLVRSKVGVEWWQRSKRTDRGGEDFRVECHDFGQRLDIVAEKVNEGLSEADADSLTQTLNEMESEVKQWPSRFDRYAPTDLMCLINAEAIINMSRKRLCTKASKETREIWQKVCELIEECDPDLYPHLVKPCVLYQRCREVKCCGYIHTEQYRKEVEEYNSLFPNSNLPNIGK